MFAKIKAMFTPPAIPDYIALAKSQISVREIKGQKNNPKIVEYHQATNLKATDDETPWCSAFVNWCLMQTGYERSHAANARSWLSVHKKIVKFEPYAIVVFRRGGNAWQGHVAFAIEDKGSSILCLGGNQNDSVCYSSYKKIDVLGYIRPQKLKPEAFIGNT